jgi:hypothetical protein
MMMLHNPNGNSVVSCPLCENNGILRFVVPTLCGVVFKNKIEIDDCPLCDGWGMVELKTETNDNRRADNPERDIHTRGSSFL